MTSIMQPRTIAALTRRSWAANRALTVMGVSMVALLAATIPLVLLDSREITGVRGWIKPAKFAVSGAIYAFTFLWMLSLVKGHRRLVGVISVVTTFTFLLEMVLIVTQVLRGTTSHFNNSTPFDTVVFSVMGVAITVFWVMNFLAAILLIRQRIESKPLAAGIRGGLIVALVGMAVAFLMVLPTDAQIAADDAGTSNGIEGAHAVGVEDGGPGLPLLNWSTEGGDLRVPHFIGLHGLQVLPLVGWLVARRLRKLGDRRSVAIVRIAGLSYLGLVALLTWQALRGQSVVSPDGLTLGALGLLAGMAIVLCLLALRLPDPGGRAAPEPV